MLPALVGAILLEPLHAALHELPRHRFEGKQAAQHVCQREWEIGMCSAILRDFEEGVQSVG